MKTREVHGLSGTKFYNTWRHMIDRCNSDKSLYYKYYAGRGIKVCERWQKVNNFKEDMYQSFLEHNKKNGGVYTSLDRIDNSGGYYKENCRWVIQKEQARNRRSNRMITYKGQTRCVKEWSEELSINYRTILTKLRRGLSFEEIAGDF